MQLLTTKQVHSNLRHSYYRNKNRDKANISLPLHIRPSWLTGVLDPMECGAISVFSRKLPQPAHLQGDPQLGSITDRVSTFYGWIIRS